MLTNLLQNGLTEEDIVNINSICLSNVNKIKVNSKADNKQNTNKSECWKVFKENLKNMEKSDWQQQKNQRKLKKWIKKSII